LPQAFSACAAGPSNRRRIYFARFTAACIIAAAENHTKKRRAACQKSLFNRQEWHLRFYLKQPCRAPKDACRAAKDENLTIFFHAPARTAIPGLKVHRAAFLDKPSLRMFFDTLRAQNIVFYGTFS
jgi:hypothetical protein